MTGMPNITTQVFKDYCSDLENLATMLEEKHGIKLVRKGGTLGGAVATVRYEMQSTEEVDWRKSAEAKAFLYTAQSYGLEPEDLGAVFYSGRVEYKLVGAVPSRPKYPFIIQGLDGKQLKAGVGIVHSVKSARKARQTEALVK